MQDARMHAKALDHQENKTHQAVVDLKQQQLKNAVEKAFGDPRRPSIMQLMPSEHNAAAMRVRVNCSPMLGCPGCKAQLSAAPLWWQK
jgi:hypothetical protein